MRGLIKTLIYFSLLAALAACADELQETISQIKPSVVPVGTYRKLDNPSFSFKGTGFVVGNGNLIATNSHVVPDAGLSEGGMFAALYSTNTETTKLIPLKLIARDEEHDLALLHIDTPLHFSPLRLKIGTEPEEGQAIAFTGFPIGGILGYSPVTHRGIISAVTPVVLPGLRSANLRPEQIRRIRRGRFNIYQLDATAYPGNSGSPVFDPANGEVLAIVNMVFVKGGRESALSAPSGITYAIPAKYLETLINSH